MNRKLTILGALLTVVIVSDIATKRWALDTLAGALRGCFIEAATPMRDFLGGHVPLTLAFNRGAAFGISIGDDPRWFFIPVALLALGLMIVLMVRAQRDDHTRIIALALVISGAIGNLIDRVRWDCGVVDFIGPIDLGFYHWPIFNIADMAISCGAVLLAISFWIEERNLSRAAREASESDGSPPRSSRS